MQEAFCCFRQGVAGMSRDLGRDVPDLEKLYARKLWADFSSPNNLLANHWSFLSGKRKGALTQTFGSRYRLVGWESFT